jgi:hypothetical protein
MKIAIWSDGYWCDYDEVNLETHRSDDYAIVVVPMIVEITGEIDEWLESKEEDPSQYDA